MLSSPAFLSAAMRSAAMSGAITDVKASTMRISVSRCFGCSSVAAMPVGDSGFTVPSLRVTMSFGAVVLKTAFARCASVERHQQLAARIFFVAQDSQALLRAVHHFRRIRSEEVRRRRHHAAVHDREVQRHVVPFDLPAPGALGARRAEHPDEVLQRIALELRRGSAPGGFSIAFRSVSSSMIDVVVM